MTEGIHIFGYGSLTESVCSCNVNSHIECYIMTQAMYKRGAPVLTISLVSRHLVLSNFPPSIVYNSRYVVSF